MPNGCYQFNQISGLKNVRLKSQFRVHPKRNTALWWIIQNIIVSLMTLSIFGVVPSNMPDFGVNII